MFYHNTLNFFLCYCCIFLCCSFCLLALFEPVLWVGIPLFVPKITFHIPIPLPAGQKAPFCQCQVSSLRQEGLEKGQDLFPGLTVLSVPLVVLCAARHAVGQLGMCPVLLCPREGDLQPQDLPSPHLWTRGAAGHCPGLLLSQMCGPWW